MSAEFADFGTLVAAFLKTRVTAYRSNLGPQRNACSSFLFQPREQQKRSSDAVSGLALCSSGSWTGAVIEHTAFASWPPSAAGTRIYSHIFATQGVGDCRGRVELPPKPRKLSGSTPSFPHERPRCKIVNCELWIFFRFNDAQFLRASLRVGPLPCNQLSSVSPSRFVVAVWPRKCCLNRASRSTAEPM